MWRKFKESVASWLTSSKPAEWYEGNRAYESGSNAESCPYMGGKSREAWMKGYRGIAMLVLLALIPLAGCHHTTSTAEREQAATEANQATLLMAQPPVRLTSSLERENINKRTLLWNDENKVSYIYLVSYGKVMAFYTIKGKVSSVNSQITNPEQMVSRLYRARTGYNRQEAVLPSPAEDGSYGTNGAAIFFFTTAGVYVEWAGDYLLCDAPLKLTTPPQIIESND